MTSVYEFGQWIAFGLSLCLLCVMVWFLLRLLFRVILLVLIVCMVLGSLYYFSLLPESVSHYVRDALSEHRFDTLHTLLPLHEDEDSVDTSDRGFDGDYEE